MLYKALAVDIDGTLQGQDRVVKPRTLKALQDVQKQGVPVIVASGRGPFLVTPEALTGFVPDYRVCANGACVLDGADKLVAQHRLREENIHQLVDFASRHQAVLSFSFEEGYYVYVATEADKWRWEEGPSTPFIKLDADRSRHLESLPFGAYCQMQDTAADAFTLPGLRAMQSSPGSYDVARDGIDKAAAIGWLLSKLGLDFSQLVAIGDSENDLDMLKAAGMGVAMGNAPAHVKKAADYVTADVNHDGVAEAIRRFFPEKAGRANAG